MNLVCHIGTPKTATTYLQETCAANPDWLRENGMVYPDLLSPIANHITLFYAAAQYVDPSAHAYGLRSMAEVAVFRGTLADQIRQQIAAAPPGVTTMLMSSENLTGNLGGPGVRELACLLRPLFDQVRIVVYLRRQDDAVLSMYGEFMRRGYHGAPFAEFVENALRPDPTPPYLNYRRLLGHWIEAFGAQAITVRLFDRAELVDGDVLTDFMAQVLGRRPDLAGLVPSGNGNESLSAPALEFLRLIQPMVPFQMNNTVNPARQRLERRINRLPGTPRPQMSATQSARIMAHYRAANDWLRQTFFPDRPGPLFAPRPELPADSNLGRISLTEFARFTGEMLQ